MKLHPADPDTLCTTPLPAGGAPLLPAEGARACARVRGLLDDHLDGSLPELLRVGVDHHLSACPACRADADGYFAVARLAGSLPPVTPPPAAEARLLAALRAAAGRPRSGELDDTRPERPLV